MIAQINNFSYEVKNLTGGEAKWLSKYIIKMALKKPIRYPFNT